MTYLHKITTKNNRSHKDSTVELVPTINCIHGVSDNGKTALLSVVEWIATNSPGGDVLEGWRTDNIKATEAITGSLEFSDGTVVERKKSSKENKYYVNDESFSAGTGVPEPVSNALQISPVNIQKQHDELFLFSSKPGEVGRFLNKLVNLGLIDSSLTAAQSHQRKVEQDLSLCEKQLESVDDQLKALPDIDNLEKLLSNAENLNNNLDSDTIIYNTLSEDITGIEDCTSILDTLEPVFKCRSLLDDSLEMHQYIENKNNLYDNVRTIINDIMHFETNGIDKMTLYRAKEIKVDILTLNKECDKLKGIINSLQSIIQEIHEIGTLKRPPVLLHDKISKALSLDNKCDELYSSRQELTELVTDIKKIECELDTQKIVIKELEEEYIEKFPDNCPFCKRVI